MPPKVTLSTSCFFPDTEMSFQVAAELGFDGVEMMVNHDKRSQTTDSVNELVAKYEIPVRSVHVPCLAVSQHVWGFNPELKLRRSVEMARDLGAELVVVHPPFRWQREYGVNFVALVDELDEAEGGPVVAVENMYEVDALGRRVNPYLNNDDPDFSDFAAVVLDTSHAAAARLDPISMYQHIDKRVRHLHLSDSTGTKGDEHLPPGRGDLHLQQLADAMKAGGYQGDVCLEVAFQRIPIRQRMESVDQTLAWTRNAFVD